MPDEKTNRFEDLIWSIGRLDLDNMLTHERQIIMRYIARVAFNIGAKEVSNPKYAEIKKAVFEFKMQRDLEKAKAEDKKPEEKSYKNEAERALERSAMKIVRDKITKN